MKCQCPKCGVYLSPELSEQWDEDGFDMQCPGCKSLVPIEVLASYSYYVDADEIDDEDE